ncbi:MAG TPA: head-tail adaptor protein [Desulfosporosinus sp.]|nr:head-tail adaptor protein [Desulfosporosinus sp.]
MPRPARRYSRRIEIWSYIANDDSFGGYTTSDSKVADAWADVTTIDRDKLTQYGLDVAQNGIQVYMRKDSSIDMTAPNMFIKIGANEYTINSVGDTDLDGLEIEITAST